VKNDELKTLQELSARVVVGIPNLVLRGDGRFLNDGEVVASSEVLENLYTARLCALELRDALAGMKGRSMTSKKKTGTTARVA